MFDMKKIQRKRSAFKRSKFPPDFGQQTEKSRAGKPKGIKKHSHRIYEGTMQRTILNNIYSLLT